MWHPLFLRSVKAPNDRHEYLRLVESFCGGDKVKQPIVAHLGRKDQYAQGVQAHLFAVAPALLLDRALEKSLRAAGSHLSSPHAWQALEMIRCVEVELGPHRKICVTRGNQHVSEVLRVAGVTHLDPPSPPEKLPCLM
jgi:hypothetical protein